MKKVVLFVGALAAVVSLASCSKAASRDDVKAQLEKSGITGSLADCVTDKMIAQFGADRLGESGTLTAEEQAAATQIGMDCATAEAGLPTSTTP